MKRKSLIAIVAVLVMMLGIPVSASDIFEKTTTCGVKGGIISPGTVWVQGISFDSEIGYNVSGFLDYKLGEKISGGLVFDFGNFSSYDESSTMLGIGFALKAWIYNDDQNYIIRPGFGIAYGNIGGNESIDATNHLVLNGYGEFVLLTEGSIDWVFEIGITGSVDGGNDDVTFTYGPGLHCAPV